MHYYEKYYVWVSSKDQNDGRQIDQLTAIGVDKKAIFVDKESCKDFNRKEYQFLINNRLSEGDTLVNTSIDRLGRNYSEIMEQWKHITKQIGANIKVLDMPLLDTTKHGSDLDQTFVADLVLQILSYVANKERENIRNRQAQGIAHAKANGIKLGRPAAQYPEGWDRVHSEWKTGNITATAAMNSLGLKRNTFYKLAKQCD